MKRLTGLAVLLAVMCMAVPTYGAGDDYYLIYNVSGSVKGANTTIAATVPWKAYLVLDVNSKINDYVDANLIIYGRNFIGDKVYLLLNQTDSNNYLGVNIWLQGNMLAVDLSNVIPFDFAMLLVGKVVEKNIGYTTNVGIPSRFKGDTMFLSGKLFDPGDRLTGTGTVSASLWLSKTQYVNAHSWTPDQIIISGTTGHKSLTQTLEAAGYKNITP
jgi:hypothetical protein